MSATDAFGRMRVSQPETLFDSKQIHDNQPLFWDDQEVSGAGTGSTHSVDAARTRMDVTAATAGVRTRQTFMSFNYQPGKSQLILMTGVIGVGETGITQTMGLMNDDNGIFLEIADGKPGLVIRSNVTGTPVNTRVEQREWTGDKMDGTGDSTVNLDFDKTQIFFIDIEWLGVGSVRCGFVVNGELIQAHKFNHANDKDTVYMSTPNLPLRYSLENDGNGGAYTMDHICSSVMSEGGSDDLGFVRSTSTSGTAVTCTSENVVYALIGIKLKATYLGAVVKLLAAALQIQTASETGEWRLILNPTVAGTFTYANETNSAVMTAKGATANTVTNGTVLASGFDNSAGNSGGAASSLDTALRTSRYLGSDIAGVVDEIVLCWMPNGGTAAHEVEATLTWREL